DEATPSGNGVAAFVLQRIGYVLGEPRYLEAAERTIRSAWLSLEKYPNGHCTLLGALEEWLSPPEIIVLRGEAPHLGDWQRELSKVYAPHRLVLAIASDARDLPAALDEKK